MRVDEEKIQEAMRFALMSWKTFDALPRDQKEKGWNVFANRGGTTLEAYGPDHPDAIDPPSNQGNKGEVK